MKVINMTKFRYLAEEETNYEMKYERPAEVDASMATRDEWKKGTTTQDNHMYETKELEILISIVVCIYCLLGCFGVWHCLQKLIKSSKKVIKEIKEFKQSMKEENDEEEEDKGDNNEG